MLSYHCWNKSIGQSWSRSLYWMFLSLIINYVHCASHLHKYNFLLNLRPLLLLIWHFREVSLVKGWGSCKHLGCLNSIESILIEWSLFEEMLNQRTESIFLSCITSIILVDYRSWCENSISSLIKGPYNLELTTVSFVEWLIGQVKNIIFCHWDNLFLWFFSFINHYTS